MKEAKRDRKESIRELCEEKVRTISNAKKSVLMNFYTLLDHTHDFSGFPELERYFSILKSNVNYKNYSLILFCIYRLSSKLDNNEIKHFECDCCQGATEFYKKMYGWMSDYVCESQADTIGKYLLRHPDKKIFFKGDTMTSVFTPLKEYIKLKSGIQCIPQTEDWELYWLNHIPTIELSDAAYSFIWYGYSPANFLPVPQGFNTGRSNFGKWDSWDLTLNQIYRWYLDNPQMSDRTNDCALEEMFIHSQNQDDTILHCTEWLKFFHSWDKFVELNYMQAFLLPDGRPKRFFKSHTLEYGLPKTTDEYEEFFQNVALCIGKRGDDINKHLNIE